MILLPFFIHFFVSSIWLETLKNGKMGVFSEKMNFRSREPVFMV